MRISEVSAAIEINKIIRYMGKSIDAGKIIERLIEKCHEAKRRIEFAQSHSWKNNVNNLLELIYIHLKPNKNVLQKY